MTELPSLARAKWLKAPTLQRVMKTIADAGGEARVAGGAVRNTLLEDPGERHRHRHHAVARARDGGLRGRRA